MARARSRGRPPEDRSPAVGDLARSLAESRPLRGSIAYEGFVPGSPAAWAEPDRLPARFAAALGSAGIRRLYTHQAKALEALGRREHLLAVTPTCHLLERMDLAGAVLAEPLAFENGTAIAPPQPGTGIAWNEDAVRRFEVRAG